jgi:hypothetical protein
VSGKEPAAKHQIVMTYDCFADASYKYPPFYEERVSRTNEIKTFLTEDLDHIYASSGTPVADEPLDGGLDGDARSQSYVHANATVSILNTDYSEVSIAKTVDVHSLNVSDGPSGRNYTITVSNYGYHVAGLSSIVDLLPRYEQMTGVPEFK